MDADIFIDDSYSDIIGIGDKLTHVMNNLRELTLDDNSRIRNTTEVMKAINGPSVTDADVRESAKNLNEFDTAIEKAEKLSRLSSQQNANFSEVVRAQRFLKDLLERLQRLLTSTGDLDTFYS